MDAKQQDIEAPVLDIDIDRILIPTNWVLIKLDDDFDTWHGKESGKDTGIHIANGGSEQAQHVALTGVAVKLPKRLIYHGEVTSALKRDNYSPENQREIADLRAESMAYKVPVEIPENSRVYFEYRTRLTAVKQKRLFKVGKQRYMFVPYDQLIMTFRPGIDMENVGYGDVYMLNGHVLIKPLTYATEKGADGIQTFKTENDFLQLPVAAEEAKYVHQHNVWYGTIISAGCRVRSYADFPAAGFDDLNVGIVGQKITYDGRHQKRLEPEFHRTIFKQHVMYRIHRKDIISVFADGNIGSVSV